MMKLIFALFAAALPAGAAAAAAAAPGAAAEAVIEWKHGPREKIIVDETIWRCRESVCRGRLIEHEPTKRRACRRLAVQGGRVLSLRTAAGWLGAEALARCNRGL